VILTATYIIIENAIGQQINYLQGVPDLFMFVIIDMILFGNIFNVENLNIDRRGCNCGKGEEK
jgi:hypothetical protein